ncbi:MAG: nickel-dependent lactate racemase [Myxococcota bacterium]
MRVALAYGRSDLTIELPDHRHSVEILEKQPVEPIRDPDAAIRRALDDPIGQPPLHEIAKGRSDAVIVISDRTRPVPNALILPPILDALRAGGLAAEAVTIQVATGLHRSNTPAELAEMLGTELARSLRIVQHDARDPSSHADLGRTEGGIPILIDRFFLGSDLRILTGLIEPHLMAGFSGGRKAVCPGLAAVETIRVAHGPAMIQSAVGPGIIDGNPLHEGLLEILRRVGADFLVNVALDRDRQIAGVFCGDVEAAHAQGMVFVENESGVAIDEAADLVIASGGGDPLDATYYQAIKGISATSGIVRPGGIILLCASLSEGIGSVSFEKLLRRFETPGEFELQLEDDEFFAIDQWMVQHLCQAHRRARLWLYTDGLPAETLRELLIEPVASVAAGVDAALAQLGPSARIAVVPQGPYVLATVAGAKRPLGGESPVSDRL